MLHAVQAVQLFQENTLLKVIAVFKFIKLCQKLDLFFMLFIKTEESSHKIFNKKMGLTLERKYF
jgi:hypothetical protein